MRPSRRQPHPAPARRHRHPRIAERPEPRRRGCERDAWPGDPDDWPRFGRPRRPRRRRGQLGVRRRTASTSPPDSFPLYGRHRPGRWSDGSLPARRAAARCEALGNGRRVAIEHDRPAFEAHGSPAATDRARARAPARNGVSSGGPSERRQAERGDEPQPRRERHRPTSARAPSDSGSRSRPRPYRATSSVPQARPRPSRARRSRRPKLDEFDGRVVHGRTRDDVPAHPWHTGASNGAGVTPCRVGCASFAPGGRR